jgi:exopolysaccharide biosynthesis polyprenyl glycosylphosphotransferase
MLRRFSVDFVIFAMVSDAVLIALSLAVATHFRPALSSLPFVAHIPPPLKTPFVLFPIFSLLWVIVLVLFSVYDRRRNLRVGDELASLTAGSLLAAISLAGILYLSYRDVSRVLFLVFFALAYLLLLSWRLAYRFAFARGILPAAQSRRVIIIGAGKVGEELAERIGQHQNLGLVLVGFLDDDLAKRAVTPKILGTLNQVRQVINQQSVDDVVLALPRRAYKRVNSLAAELHDMPVKVWVIPDYFSLVLLRSSMEEFASLPMLDLRAPALNEYQRTVKRAFDLALTLVSLPLIFPLLGLVALAIRLNTPGPVLLRQKRAGENGHLFEMFKFRTMVQNADELRCLVEQADGQGHLLHKHPGDPRVTSVGRFLRRTSLDELPQIFNVLRGEMSLVGPRPELPYLVEKYEPWQRKRFAVPQGMTGWWQVNGRGEKLMHLHTEEDLFYVQHYSLWLDLRILFKTFWVVLRGKGAF